MKRKILFILCICFALSLCACTGDSNDKNPPTQTITPSAPPYAEPSPNLPDDEDVPEFKLSAEETVLYENFVKNLDKTTFIGVEPASIAKILEQCYVNGDWEAEYEMYNEASRNMLKEEYKALYGQELTEAEKAVRKETADIYFSLLDEASFYETENGRGTLTVDTVDENFFDMYFIKNPAGYWELFIPSFMLTDEEEALYQEYKKSQNEDIFKDVPLVSIMKVMFQSGINGEIEAEYQLYTTNGETIKIEYPPLSTDNADADIAYRKRVADTVFLNMDKDYTFTDRGNGWGYLLFKDVQEETVIMYFQNDTGNWKPATPSFDLGDEEQALYDAFLTDYDRSIFKDVSPATIAQIYIQYGIDANWEAEYEITNPESRTISKEEAEEENSTDLSTLDVTSRKTMADAIFPFLKDAIFTDEGNGKGYIDYKNVYYDDIRMYFIKHTDGYWEIKFSPFEG